MIYVKFREIDFEVILMTNFRSQLKQAVAKMVQECCKWITEGTLSSKDVEVELINTLRTVTEGKIYVEVERARLTHRLAKMKVNKQLTNKMLQKLTLSVEILIFPSLRFYVKSIFVIPEVQNLTFQYIQRL